MPKDTHKNAISYQVWGKHALFTDPLTKTGGEKCSYHLPTYEAIKGITESIYWKPTFTWIIDKVRILKPIRTESKNIKPIKLSGGNDLATYTYLAAVHYEVLAHFEWNLNRDDLKHDRIDGKHWDIAKRMIQKGGRRDIFLGTRECQGYVEPSDFGEQERTHQQQAELSYGLMFHGFDYPDTTGNNELHARFWQAKVDPQGIIHYPRPDDSSLIKRHIRDMNPTPPKSVGLNEPNINFQ